MGGSRDGAAPAGVRRGHSTGLVSGEGQWVGEGWDEHAAQLVGDRYTAPAGWVRPVSCVGTSAPPSAVTPALGGMGWDGMGGREVDDVRRVQPAVGTPRLCSCLRFGCALVLHRCVFVSPPPLFFLSPLSPLSLFLSCLGLPSSNAHLRRVGPPAMGGAARGSRGPGVSYVPPGPCPRVLRSQPWGARHEVTSALPRDVYIGPRTAR